MKKTVFMFASLVRCVPAVSLVRARPLCRPGESCPRNSPLDLTDLQLSEPRRLELEDAFKRQDYKRAESILVEEAERDTKSIRTANSHDAGAIFFLDGQYLNSAIAWKKAEA